MSRRQFEAMPNPRRSTVRLIGVLLSPYVRRVAVGLNILQLPFEHDGASVFGEPDFVRRHNPLVRNPILVVDDGANLVESGAILDEIGHMVGPDRRLTPSDGPLRRRVLQTAAMALGCADKAQWAFYEDRVRPAEKVHTPWIEHNDRQVLGQASTRRLRTQDTCHLMAPPTGVTRECKLQEERRHV